MRCVVEKQRYHFILSSSPKNEKSFRSPGDSDLVILTAESPSRAPSSGPITLVFCAAHSVFLPYSLLSPPFQPMTGMGGTHGLVQVAINACFIRSDSPGWQSILHILTFAVGTHGPYSWDISAIDRPGPIVSFLIHAGGNTLYTHGPFHGHSL